MVERFLLIGLNTARALAACLSLSAQRAEPEQAPFQRTKRMPAAGLGVSKSRAPAFHVVVQLAAQRAPAGRWRPTPRRRSGPRASLDGRAGRATRSPARRTTSPNARNSRPGPGRAAAT